MKFSVLSVALLLASPAELPMRAHAEDAKAAGTWTCTYTTRKDETPHVARWQIKGPNLIDLNADQEGDALGKLHRHVWRISVNNEISLTARLDEDLLGESETKVSGAVSIDKKTNLYSMSAGATEYEIGHDSNSRHEENGTCKSGD